MKKSELIELGLVEGSVVKINYTTIEILGIIKNISNDTIFFIESVIIKSSIFRNEFVKKPTLYKDTKVSLEGCDSIEKNSINKYKNFLLERNCENISESSANYYIVSQWIVENYLTNLEHKKDIFIFEKGIKFKLKTNLTKANWCSIKLIEDDLFFIEFTSEYYDKTSSQLKSNLKYSFSEIDKDKIKIQFQTKTNIEL